MDMTKREIYASFCERYCELDLKYLEYSLKR